MGVDLSRAETRERPKNPSVKHMVIEQLKAGGFDGLSNFWQECACEIDDLAPCGSVGNNCVAGYRIAYPDGCPGGYCDGGCDYHIEREKPEAGDA